MHVFTFIPPPKIIPTTIFLVIQNSCHYVCQLPANRTVSRPKVLRERSQKSQLLHFFVFKFDYKILAIHFRQLVAYL